jgi:membrane protein implicated in regulation of membrane protease activity
MPRLLREYLSIALFTVVAGIAFAAYKGLTPIEWTWAMIMTIAVSLVFLGLQEGGRHWRSEAGSRKQDSKKGGSAGELSSK